MATISYNNNRVTDVEENFVPHPHQDGNGLVKIELEKDFLMKGPYELPARELREKVETVLAAVMPSLNMVLAHLKKEVLSKQVTLVRFSLHVYEIRLFTAFANRFKQFLHEVNEIAINVCLALHYYNPNGYSGGLISGGLSAKAEKYQASIIMGPTCLSEFLDKDVNIDHLLITFCTYQQLCEVVKMNYPFQVLSTNTLSDLLTSPFLSNLRRDRQHNTMFDVASFVLALRENTTLLRLEDFEGRAVVVTYPAHAVTIRDYLQRNAQIRRRSEGVVYARLAERLPADMGHEIREFIYGQETKTRKRKLEEKNDASLYSATGAGDGSGE